MDGNLKRLIVDRPADRQLLVRRRYAAVAGVLCAGASLCTLASSILLEGAPAMTAIGLASFGLLLAFLCFVVPWEQVAVPLVHLAPAAATLAIAIATTTIDPTYGFYLVLVAGFVAYTFSDRGVLAIHLGLIAVALLAPVVIESESTRKAIACMLIFGPGVILVTVLAIYQRRSGEARDRAYREFAADALALASRIRSRVGTGGPLAGGEWIEQPAPAVPLRSVGIAKVVRTEVVSRNGSRSAGSGLQQRIPMAAVAIAASIVAVVSTTAALLRDGGERPVTVGAAPALVRDDTSRTVADLPRADAKRPARRHRHERAPAATEATPAAPAPAAPVPAETPEPSGGGSPQPASPAPPSGGQATVPTRPQTGEPVSEPPPTPVQQGAPAGPVDTAVGVVHDTVDPVVDGLQK